VFLTLLVPWPASAGPFFEMRRAARMLHTRAALPNCATQSDFSSRMHGRGKSDHFMKSVAAFHLGNLAAIEVQHEQPKGR
jgi:hypothetical protein